MNYNIIKNSFWKHYKGNIYKVINIATCSETYQRYIIYSEEPIKKLHINETGVWIRSMKNFMEEVEINDENGNIKRVSRFEKLKY